MQKAPGLPIARKRKIPPFIILLIMIEKRAEKVKKGIRARIFSKKKNDVTFSAYVGPLFFCKKKQKRTARLQPMYFVKENKVKEFFLELFVFIRALLPKKKVKKGKVLHFYQ